VRFFFFSFSLSFSFVCVFCLFIFLLTAFEWLDDWEADWQKVIFFFLSLFILLVWVCYSALIDEILSKLYIFLKQELEGN
jgi:hypothetical protein